MRNLKPSSLCIALALLLTGITFFSVPVTSYGAENSLGDASEIAIGGGEGESIRETITNITVEALKYVALISTIVIIIAGIILIVGVGSDPSRDRAKNIILYTIIGMIVILLAAGIVNVIVRIGGG